MDEIFDLVDDLDEVIGSTVRSHCHGNPKLIHRAVHVLVFSKTGEIYLQRRSEKKLIQPGKWDTSVGGHIARGESYIEAACRETREELGFDPAALNLLFSYKVRNEIESENIKTFFTIFDGTIDPDPEEIEEGRHWDARGIADCLGSGVFTPVFEREIELLRNVDNPLLKGWL